MEEKANTGQVIIVLTEHLTFGTLLIPYMAEKSNDGTYQLIEQAFHAFPEAISRMNEAEQQAINIASHYTEKYLMGIYSREKTVSRFLRKLSEDPERVKNNIRPFIEKKLQEMLTLIRHHNLPLYQKQVGSKLLYAHHAYHVHPHDVEIRFTFLADETNFRYQLQCYYDGQPLSLSEQKPVIVLTSSPSALLLGMELYFFPHIESVRILPFTKKKKISVPASQIEKYIDNIVIPIARYHEITTQGLNIIEETYACEAVLSLEDTIYDEQMLRLSFRYGDQSFTPDTVTEMKKIIYRNDFGEIFFFRRDSDAEEEKLRMLTDSGLQRVSDVHFKLSPDAPEKTITEWISTYRKMLQQSFLLTGNMGNTPYCLDEIRIEQSCDDEPDWFELHITVVIGNLRIPFSRFRKHILEEKREFLLPDGRMILLPEEWFSKYGNLLELGTQTETGIRLKPTFVGAVQSALEENGPKDLPFKREIRNVPVPQGLNAKLRPYQQKGFSWMVQLNKQGFGGCLADDMGLGKTLQVIALLTAFYQEKTEQKAAGNEGSGSELPLPSLIVCPASLVYNWGQEFARFSPEIRVLLIAGTAKERQEQLEEQMRMEASEGAQVIITSYDLLKRDRAAYLGRTFEYEIIDEAQVIKNAKTQGAKAVKEISANARFALTGTPVENRLSELWSIFDFLMPGFLYGYRKFRERYELPIVKNQDPEALTALRRMTGPFVLRRLKKDVLRELPGKEERIVYSAASGRQQKLYTASALKLKEALAGGAWSGNGKLEVLSQLMRLRQICCDPALCFEDYTGESAKLETCVSLIASASAAGHKILLFSQFASMLERIRERLLQEGISSHLLVGATPKEERSRMVQAFASDEVPVFLISLKAGGTGLNLTAADIVIHYDPWWNVAAQNQATDRAYRIGQEKPVTVYKLILKDTIEENLLKLQNAKLALAAQVVSEGMVSLGDLSQNELMELFEQNP